MFVYPFWMCLCVPQCCVYLTSWVPVLTDTLGQREGEVCGQDEPQWSRFRCFFQLSISLVLGSSAAALGFVPGLTCTTSQVFWGTWGVGSPALHPHLCMCPPSFAGGFSPLPPVHLVSWRLSLLLRCSAGDGSFFCCYLGRPQAEIPERRLQVWMCLLETAA